MMKSFDMATADRREMLLDKDRLHAIGQQIQASWATGNRLRDMQAPPKKARAKPQPRSRKHEAGGRGDDSRVDRLLGARRRAGRLGAGGRAVARTCFTRCCGSRWR